MSRNKYQFTNPHYSADLLRFEYDYAKLTAFINGVNDTHSKIALRNGINWQALMRGEPYQRVGESVMDYLNRILILEPQRRTGG